MEQTHAEPNYMKIFWWLLALTIIEVGVVYAHLPKGLHGDGALILHGPFESVSCRLEFHASAL